MSEKMGDEPSLPSGLTDTLPDGIKPYSASPVFTADNLPDALKTAHTVKAGTWGGLKVHSGALRYVRDSVPHAEVVLVAGQQVVIEPQIQHHVAFESPGSFQITFCRADA